MALHFFAGDSAFLSTTITNPYSGDIFTLNGTYIVNNTIYTGTATESDTLLMSPQTEYLSFENELGSPVLESIETVLGSDGDDVIDLTSATYALDDMSISGGAGNDLIWANAGDDTLDGGTGSDILDGGPGNDILDGGDDDDTIGGGDGDDTLIGGAGADALDGGTGSDTADYSASSAAVEVNLLYGSGDGGDAEGDTYTSIENIIGSDLSADYDYLTGNAAANRIQALAGDDYIEGRGGADIIDGGDGADTAVYLNSGSGVTVDLGAGTATGGDAQGDVLTNIENLYGSNHNDILTGDAQANSLSGFAGDDVLDGGAGDDILTGDEGDDMLYGGDGADTYYYSEGNDTIVEASSADINIIRMPYGILESDLSFNFIGNDLQIVVGTLGTILLSGQYDAADSGIDTVYFYGGTSLDLRGIELPPAGPTEGDDALDGTDGDDVIDALAGDDVVNGLDGDDMLTGGAGSDTLDGGDGNDTAAYENSDAAVQVNLGAGTATGGHAQGDILSNIENLRGSSYGDTLTGDALANVLSGLDGDDTLFGGAGEDTLDGGAGDDTMAGGDGADTYVAGIGNDTIVEASSADINVIDLPDGIVESDLTFNINGNDLEIIVGTTGTILVSGQFDAADSGIDTLNFSDGTSFDLRTVQPPPPPSTEPSDGDDVLTGSDGGDIINAQAGDDIVHGLKGSDLIYGGDGDDTLYGDGGSDMLIGGSGNDTLLGGAGNDVLIGGSGDDTFVIGKGSDTVFALLGDDRIVYDVMDGKADSIYGFTTGENNDVLDISDILEGYDPLTDSISDFVRIGREGWFSSTLEINADGDAGGAFTTVAVFKGGLQGASLNDLLDDGNLIVDHQGSIV